jgi:ubiquinone/menaquinone biosynthesis C-methylase UbiE
VTNAKQRHVQARSQRRIQRDGWDLAAGDYELLWREQLAAAQARLLEFAALAPRERVLDVACGTGLVTLEAANAVGTRGHVLGVDISEQMIIAARVRARQRDLTNVRFERMGAEHLDVPNASFDAALCALGLMYAPDPEQAVCEMARSVRPGGRIALAVWGERSRCGWASVFPIVDAELASDVCPLFFALGLQDALADLCRAAGCDIVEHCRMSTPLLYASADDACAAAFLGGPVAHPWSRFDDKRRARVRARYLESIEPWRNGNGYMIPGEFVLVAANVPQAHGRRTMS